MTDGHPSGSVTRLRELVEQLREGKIPTFDLSFDPLTEQDVEGGYPIVRLEDVETFLNRRADELAAALAPAVVPSVDAEQLAQRFHEAYERLAPQFSYRTREASAKPWADVPEQNRRLMIAVCAEILSAAPPLVAPVAHEHVYRMDPVTETAFCECGQMVTLAESVAPVAAPVQEKENPNV